MRFITLADGRTLRVRAVGLQDADAVQSFVRSLSWRARVQRFFSPIQELTPRQLERALSGQGLHLAALDAGGTIVALAQYALDDLPENPGRAPNAEFGVVVADAWQHHGIGERLMQMLLDEARRSGITRLGGVTQADNDPMRLLARKLGFAFRRDEDPRLVRMERALAA
jgi:GNAT superfamily N-acetyltransferase